MNLKKFFFVSLSAAVLLALIIFLAAFLRYQSWASDSKPAEKLTAYFERITKSDFQYQSMSWKLMPLPVVRFSHPSFHFKSELRHELSADFLDLQLDLFKLILGEIGFSGLKLHNGTWKGQIDAPKGIHNFLVEQIDLKASALVSNRPVKIYMSGDSGGRRKAVILHGEVTLPPLEDESLNSLGFQVQLLTRNFRFQDSPEWEFLGWVPSSGPSDFLIVLRRLPSSDRIIFSGDAGLHDLIFRDADQGSAKKYNLGNLQLKYSGYFSPSTDELKFNQCSAQLPFAGANLQGTYLPHRREFRALTFTFSDVKLDELTSNFPDIKDRIPYFIGFSGMANLSVSLNGYLNRLKIYGDFDFTRTLFTYGRFFQKSKEKSFRLKTDFDWKDEMLSGEFSGNFEALNFKGSLTEWRPSGEVKVNLITNSFLAEHLSGALPFLTDYEFGGNMKFFGDWKGNFMDEKPFERMFNLTLQDAQVLRKGTGAGLKNMNMSLDFSPLQTEARSVSFNLGGSVFDLDMRGVQLENNPRWSGTLKSKKLIAAQAWKEWTDFWGGGHEAWLKSQHVWIRRLILSEEPFENLSMNFSFGSGVLDVSNLESDAFDGKLTGALNSRTGSDGQAIEVILEGTEMSADKFFQFSGATASEIQGKLAWNADFKGSRPDDSGEMSWAGPFSMLVREGQFNRFDWAKALRQTDLFKDSNPDTSGVGLTFSRLSAAGQIQDDRLYAEKIELQGDSLWIDGEGSVNRDGILNLRLRTKIDAGMFREIFPKRAGDFVGPEESFFGPVTLLASGPLEALSVKPDPQSVAELAAHYARKKTESLSRYL